MPSQRFANEIRQSLAPGERAEDFEYLFDALMSLRTPYNGDNSASEGVTARLLCVLFPDKPQSYIRAMQHFRLAFIGVAAERELQAEFVNSVRPAALKVSTPGEIVWRPGLYFSKPRRLRRLDDWWY
jgi:hypothetical protein